MEIKSILVDFDGTLAQHEYPILGKPAPDAIRVVTRLQDAGHTLILHTMRDGDELAEAIAWCKDFGIEFKYINCNPEFETGSRKVYGHFVLDDHNIGIPLVHDLKQHRKPFVDWIKTEKLLEEKGLL